MKYKRQWIKSNKIEKNHQKVTITQIYCWLISFDKKTIIVSKNDKDWQIPGGHPIQSESFNETIIREIYEETGLDIRNTIKQVQMFGYYFIKCLDKNNIETNQILQLRYVLRLSKSSKNLSIRPRENNQEPNASKIIIAKFVNYKELLNNISWLKNTKECEFIKDYLI